MTTKKVKAERKSAGDLKNLCILSGNFSRVPQVQERVLFGLYVSGIYEDTPVKLPHIPPNFT